MQDNYGKLIVTQPGMQERAFELGKASVTLGRATTNDIVLDEGRVSRSHARLECGPSGCQIVDLGSSNGTRVNGLRVERAVLQPGDVVGIGSAQLRYVDAAIPEDAGLTVIDSEADLDKCIECESLPMSVSETGVPRLVVFTAGRTWELPLDAVDRVTIGRTDENQIVLEHTKVSRRHAEVVRKGDSFLLRDLGSTNGTWLQGERVGEAFLQNSDVFRIGEAQIVFKAGFGMEALTILGDALRRGPERRPVVFVPGFLGSEMWLGSERLWPNVRMMLTSPDTFRYSPDTKIEARGIVNEMVIVPNLIKQDQYNRLGDYFVEELGYERGRDFFEFAYDWRQDARISARLLGRMIESLPTTRPVMLMAHSLGTLVSRYYVERLGGSRHVERLVLMGGPHYGTVKALTSLLVGPKMLPFGLLGERMRRVLATFPSSYQILPTYATGVDQNGQAINFLEEEGWVPAEHLPLLRSARDFRAELGMRTSVPTLCVFGYGIKTISSVSVHRENGVWSQITYSSEPRGDNGILETSAVLPDTEIHPVQQYHGSLFVDNDVKMRLKIELARP
jgi:pSer/pThr/pTyr-binding forkhead associated (FHA) protein